VILPMNEDADHINEASKVKNQRRTWRKQEEILIFGNLTAGVWLDEPDTKLSLMLSSVGNVMSEMKGIWHLKMSKRVKKSTLWTTRMVWYRCWRKWHVRYFSYKCGIKKGNDKDNTVRANHAGTRDVNPGSKLPVIVSSYFIG